MYLDQPGRALGAGHESAGVTSPATQWFLAEGATGTYFDLFILIANPQTATAAVQADFLLTSGQVITKTYTVGGNSRFNIWVDLEDPPLANAAVSTRVTSTNGVPIIVERAMWWPGPTSATWQEAHNSPGETTTGTRWAIAEGEIGWTAQHRDLRADRQHVGLRPGRRASRCCSKTARRRSTRTFPLHGQQPVERRAGGRLPRDGGQAVRHADREHRRHTGADRRRARDVLELGRREMGCRHQRPGNAAALNSD